MSSGQRGLGHRRWATSRPHEPMEASNSESSVSLTWDHTVCQQTYCPVLITSGSCSGYILSSSFNLPSSTSNTENIHSPCCFTSSQSPLTSSDKPTSTSSTDASPEGGDSATFHFLDDPSSLDSSGECKTNPFPS